MSPVAEIHPPERSAPRYWPRQSLPAYRFVPGLHPHPRRDPRGHSFAAPPRPPHLPWNVDSWRTLADWLFGVDCFNAFYWWEAHESWEVLWAATARDGAAARLLQGLIQIAAALLKVHLGSLTGASTLSRAGLAKIAHCAARVPSMLGLDVRDTLNQFTHYFRPLTQRTLPRLDASVPLLLLQGLPHA